jgi:hypothetical protein
MKRDGLVGPGIDFQYMDIGDMTLDFGSGIANLVSNP